MDGKMLLAIILIVVGAIAFAYQGITYTKKEKILDIGPVEMTAEKDKTIPLPRLSGLFRLRRASCC